jgi:hypothetical protein
MSDAKLTRLQAYDDKLFQAIALACDQGFTVTHTDTFSVANELGET